MNSKPNGRKATPKTSGSRAAAQKLVPRTRLVKKPRATPPSTAHAKPSSKLAVKADALKAPTVPATLLPPVRHSKQARLIALLGSAPGATVDQMMKLTGWQAHTVRGTISGVLRKRLGLNVTCEAAAESGARLYRIIGAGASA